MVGVAAAVPIGVTALLFGQGGWMNISASDTVHAVLAALVVAALVSRPAVRVGAVLAALGVLAAFAVHTPVGLNATRLPVMFTLPVVAGYAVVPERLAARMRPAVAAPVALGLVLVVLAWWLPPVLVGDLRDAGNASAYPSYFAPLRAELARRGPVGRIEVPPTRDYWEAAYATPLARGWLRQVDLARNPLFFTGTLTPAEYRDWLVGNGVEYVAVADVEGSWVGAREATLIRAGLPYLAQVWRDAHWTLYRVDGATGGPSVAGPGAALAGQTGAALTVDVDRPGRTVVRVRWSRWLTVSGPSGARLAPGRDWTELVTTRSGRYTISSKVVSPG